MRMPNRVVSVAAVLVLALPAVAARAQSSPTRLPALEGLVPVSVLDNTQAGRKALAANLAVTGAIQQDAAKQKLLLPFAEQQQQALRDAFITSGNAAELADGLGTRLGGVYQAAATYHRSPDGKDLTFTNVAPSVGELIAYAQATAGSDADAGKYFFGNGTTDGTRPVVPAEAALFTQFHGIADIFGIAYHRPAGSEGAGKFGNSRPFQTEPHFLAFTGRDYFGDSSGNTEYLRGPAQNLVDSPSYPSGHTTYGTTQSMLLALMVPQRYAQMVTRGAEYGNNRIIMGAHYTMDVLGGRTLALYDLAHLLANAQGYVGETRHGVTITDFGKALAQARADLTRALEAGCGATVTVCAGDDSSRFAQAGRNATFYETTQTYGLPVVYARTAQRHEDVARLAPEAGYLLTVAFPKLSLAQADAILTETEGPGGGFLDNGSGFGVYSRLDLYRAAQKAAASP